MRERIARFMTPCPFTIGADQPMAAAHRVMRERGVRHLPVLAEGRLVGVVSQRDLYFLETIAGVDPKSVTVEEAMTAEPFVVDAGASVERVAREMAFHKYGCAIVMERGEVTGLFTTTDACAALAEVLRASNHGPRRAAPARPRKRRAAR